MYRFAHPTAAMILAAPLAIALAGGAANAQAKNVEIFPDHLAPPLFGTLTGQSGDFIETQSVDVEAGGANYNLLPEFGCGGAIDYGQPDVTLDYRKGDATIERLNILAFGDEDTTLVVRSPEGTWLCDDDSAGDANPLISVIDPNSGTYAIWVGTFFGGVADATLTVTENGFPKGSGIDIPDPLAAALHGTLDLGSGLADGPVETDVTAGGPSRIPDFIAFCTGWYDTGRASLHIENVPPGQGFHIDVASMDDTTLAVLTPDGEWICNDDFNGSSPRVTIAGPMPGRYTVWAGTFDDTGGVEAQIVVSAIRQPDPTATAQAGVVDLGAGFADGNIELAVTAGGADRITPLSGFCSGNFDVGRPAVHIENVPAGQVFRIYITSEADTTLAVLTPGGEWLCNDDSFGLDPEIAVDNPVPGRYAVWVGTFSDGPGGSPARLIVSETGAGVIPDPDLPAAIGTILLSDVALDAPQSHAIVPGGDRRVSSLGANCIGQINADQPTVHIDNDTAGEDFTIRVAAAHDTTLIVLTPDGRWLCNDDFDGLDPALYIGETVAGRYTVWVGVFFSDATDRTATLTIDRAAG